MTQKLKTFKIETEFEIKAIDKEDCKKILLSQLQEDMNEGILVGWFLIKERKDHATT